MHSLQRQRMLCHEEKDVALPTSEAHIGYKKLFPGRLIYRMPAPGDPFRAIVSIPQCLPASPV